MPSEPKITPQLDGLRIEWIPEKITCDITALYQHHDGNVACELHLSTSQAGFGPHLLRHHINDLANATSRDRLAGLLTKAYNHVPWGDMTETICEYVLFHLRRPPKLITSTDFTEAKRPEFILHPFLLRHENNMIFSPGGGGKSNLALYWLILLEIAKQDNLFNWIVRETPLMGLYLDWERSYNTHSYRMRGLLDGLEIAAYGPETPPLNYYRLHAPLAQEVRNVQGLINEAKASFLICDSCGMAAGGDMNKTEPAIQFFGGLGALRAFDGHPLTNLLISHTSKDPTTSKRTPYGNAYWGFECSSIWELIPGESPDRNLHRITLHCFKHNDYAWIPDLGIEIAYEDGAITYRPGEIQAAGVEVISRSHWLTIYEALGSTSSLKTLTELTGLSYDAVRNNLRGMLEKGHVRKLKYGAWGQGIPVGSW